MILSTGSCDYRSSGVEGDAITAVMVQGKLDTGICFILKVPKVDDSVGIATHNVTIHWADVELNALVRVHIPLEQNGRCGQVPEVPFQQTVVLPRPNKDVSRIVGKSNHCYAASVAHEARHRIIGRSIVEENDLFMPRTRHN